MAAEKNASTDSASAGRTALCASPGCPEPGFRVLVINPGSTSTKVAVYEGGDCVFREVVAHTNGTLARFPRIADQLKFRLQAVLNVLKEKGFKLTDLDAVVGRGGLLKPVEGGAYAVNEAMLHDLEIGEQGEHASNLGGIIAHSIAQEIGAPAFVVDPVSVDEFEPVARISGIPEIERKSLLHALNLRAVARRVARDLKKDLCDINLVMAHLGGGISVCACKRGRIVDVNNGMQQGPFSPERAGGVPAYDVVKLAFSGRFTQSQLLERLFGKGGLVAYLGTNDAREVEARIAKGDEYALLIYQAMAYQIAKEIGAMASVLSGEVAAVVMTGGLAYSSMLVGWLEERVSFIAPVLVYPGEDEMKALADGACRVLRGEEAAKTYA